MSKRSRWPKVADDLVLKTIPKKMGSSQGTADTGEPAIHKKVIVLSFDALSAEDWPVLKQYPNFNKLIAHGKYSRQVRSVYPSLTYPSHASVLTGKMPRKHGIVSNTKLQPMRIKPDWFWKHKEIHGKTLFSEAKAKNLSVASILWPVSAGAPIQFNMPEVFPNRPWHNQVSISLLSGRKRYQLQMNGRHGHLRKGENQPQLDNFAHACALDTLKTYQPDMLFVHYTDLDKEKHLYGASSNEAKAAIKRLDQRLEDYFRVIKQLGIDEETTFIIFGDHGSRDVHSVIRPNVILQKEGFLSAEENGKILHCDYVFKSCDGSAYLYHNNLHKIKRELIRQEVAIIQTAVEKFNENFCGIKEIISGHEAGYEGADNNALLMLEAEAGYYFLDDSFGEIVQGIDEEKVGTEHWLRAAHGYHPDTGHYNSVFFAFGDEMEKKEIGEIDLMDIGVSIANLMGLELGETDGKVIY